MIGACLSLSKSNLSTVFQAIGDSKKKRSVVGGKVKMEINSNEKTEWRTTMEEEESQLEKLLNDKLSSVTFSGQEGKKSTNGRQVILSGSFNPLHDGHLALMAAACSVIPNNIPVFEISIINADKPPLAVSEVIKRVRQFEKRGFTVVVTNQPFFFRKAEILPDSTFVIGYDTAIRLLNPKYYGASRENMIEVLKGIQNRGCDFLVAGRVSDGVFHELTEVDIPSEISDLFRDISENNFRMDISSTEIRAKMENKG